MSDEQQTAQRNLETKIRWAAALVFAGLVCILLSFSKIHPLAFVAFLAIACPLTVAGIGTFLMALLPSQKTANPQDASTE